MALRYATWLAAVLTVSAIVLLVRTQEGSTAPPAATDVLFVFDTTGSMSGALSEAQAQAAGRDDEPLGPLAEPALRACADQGPRRRPRCGVWRSP